MSHHDVAEVPQRIAIVLEHNADDDEDGGWNVVSYLICDTGRRERATLSALPDRDSAAAVLQELWQQMRRR